MLIGKVQKVSLLKVTLIFAIALLVTSCGGGGSAQNNVVQQYYSAIEAGNADAAAALFAEDAVITTPSGNVVTGLDAINGQFIPYDLNSMDRVEFLSDFTESNGKITWLQAYHELGGNTFESKCEVTIENGKIVEWVFSNP